MSCCGFDLAEEEEEQFSSLGGFQRIRKCTDRVPLIGMGIFFATLFVLIGVALITGDIGRFTSGYDSCGNVCGRNNIAPADSPFHCFGKDMTDKKYLLTTYTKFVDNKHITRYECVHNCEEEGAFVLFLNRCFKKPTSDDDKDDLNISGNFFQNVSDDFQQSWGQIVLACFFALILSIMMLFLLRYATAWVVWFTLIALMALFVGLSIYCWVLYGSFNSDDSVSDPDRENTKSALLVAAIALTVFAFVIILLTAVFFKRIKLIIQLFKEAAKAVAAMPGMIFQPVWTFIALFVIYTSGAYFSLWISSEATLSTFNGTEFNERTDSLIYQPTVFSLISTGWNLFAIIWMIQFVIGCQHFIIGGCVSTWFFSRDKTQLGSPILSNSTNLVKFHLGTVAFGSLLITLVEILKQFIRGLRRAMEEKKNIVAVILLCILQSCIEWFEELLKFFSRNAYIITAVYGYSYCKSGKKALRLLLKNIFSVAAINSLGDYVLTFMKLFIILFTTLIGYEVLKDKQLHYIAFPLIVIFLLTCFISHCFITVFEMTIDTIFLCFCEDCEQNDGISKPYYMSRNLMEFVENSSKITKVWEAEQLLAWENGPKRVL